MIKKTIYTKTQRTTGLNKIIITEKIDGSNLTFFKYKDELYFAQRNFIFNLSELEEMKQMEIKKAKTLSAPTNTINIISQRGIMDKKMWTALAKRKLSNPYNLFFTGSDLWLLLFIVYIKRYKTRLLSGI